jgi:hypothetical protein
MLKQDNSAQPLGKRTTSNRWLTARHLSDLYGLDQTVTVFRLLRMFWATDAPSRPMLALLCAMARDALLRLSAQMVLATKPGESLTSGDFLKHFEREQPGRFSESMILSLSQNVVASWAQAGLFRGKDLSPPDKEAFAEVIVAWTIGCLRVRTIRPEARSRSRAWSLRHSRQRSPGCRLGVPGQGAPMQ